jgi:hypothetical protein
MATVGEAARVGGSVSIMFGAFTSLVGSVELLLAHRQAGDLLMQSCTSSEVAAWSGWCPTYLFRLLGQIGLSLTVLSPGIPALKRGLFARPTSPAPPPVIT